MILVRGAIGIVADVVHALLLAPVYGRGYPDVRRRWKEGEAS